MLTWFREWRANRQWQSLGPIAQLLIALEAGPELRKALRKVLRVKGYGE